MDRNNFSVATWDTIGGRKIIQLSNLNVKQLIEWLQCVDEDISVTIPFAQIIHVLDDNLNLLEISELLATLSPRRTLGWILHRLIDLKDGGSLTLCGESLCDPFGALRDFRKSFWLLYRGLLYANRVHHLVTFGRNLNLYESVAGDLTTYSQQSLAFRTWKLIDKVYTSFGSHNIDRFNQIILSRPRLCQVEAYSLVFVNTALPTSYSLGAACIRLLDHVRVPIGTANAVDLFSWNFPIPLVEELLKLRICPNVDVDAYNVIGAHSHANIMRSFLLCHMWVYIRNNSLVLPEPFSAVIQLVSKNWFPKKKPSALRHLDTSKFLDVIQNFRKYIAAAEDHIDSCLNSDMVIKLPCPITPSLIPRLSGSARFHKTMCRGFSQPLEQSPEKMMKVGSPSFQNPCDDSCKVFETSILLRETGATDDMCEWSMDAAGRRPRVGRIIDSAFRKHDWKAGDSLFIEFTDAGRSRTGGGISRCAIQTSFSSNHCGNKTCIFSYIIGGQFAIPIRRHLFAIWMPIKGDTGTGLVLDFVSGNLYRLTGPKITDSSNYSFLYQIRPAITGPNIAGIYQAYWSEGKFYFRSENTILGHVKFNPPAAECVATQYVILEFLHNKGVRFAVNTSKPKGGQNMFHFFNQLTPCPDSDRVLYRPPFWQWSHMTAERYDDFVHVRACDCMNSLRKRVHPGRGSDALKVERPVEARASEMAHLVVDSTLTMVPLKRGRGRPRKDGSASTITLDFETVSAQKRLLIAKKIWTGLYSGPSGRRICPLCQFPLSGSFSSLDDIPPEEGVSSWFGPCCETPGCKTDRKRGIMR